MRKTKSTLPVFIILLLGGYAFAQEAADQAAKENVGSTEVTIERPELKYTAQDSRDPFQSATSGQPQPGAESGVPAAEKKALPQLTVQGVIWGGNLPQAIINNKVLKVGDTIEGAQVKNIGKEGITVLFEGSEYNLSSPATGPGPAKNPQGG
jgi:hypothetical protein